MGTIRSRASAARRALFQSLRGIWLDWDPLALNPKMETPSFQSLRGIWLDGDVGPSGSGSASFFVSIPERDLA